VIQVLIPATAFASTLVLRDGQGTQQFLLGFATNLVATHGLKRLIDRDRPDGGTHSFPSGHTSAAFQGASFIHLRYGAIYAVPAYAGAAFVGFSRVYADKHYVSDVVVGAGIGFVSSWVFTDRYPGVSVAYVSGDGARGLAVRVALP